MLALVMAVTAVPSRGGQFVLHTRALPGNPYDDHTLGAVIDATEKLTAAP
jgi:IS5 family transposase